MRLSVSEKTIEDILASDRSIVAELLEVETDDLDLIARQKPLKEGKLDLLYLCRDRLLLVELKATPFADDILTQLERYQLCLEALQDERRLVRLPIVKVALVAGTRPGDAQRCKGEGVVLVSYEPDLVLSRFYENFRYRAYYLDIQAADYGVVRLGLTIHTLQLLGAGKDISEICKIQQRSENTIRNRLSVARHLGLVTRFRNEYYLTDFGVEFLQQGERDSHDHLTPGQAEMLGEFVRNAPYFSTVTYTILTMLETVFVLSKSEYPVPEHAVRDYFVKAVGKQQTWQADKARQTATYIFSNYAVELDYLALIGKHYYLTPRGIQAILLLQLNRSIKLIEAQS